MLHVLEEVGVRKTHATWAWLVVCLVQVFNSRQLEIPGSLVSANKRLKQRLTDRGTLVVKQNPGFCLFVTQNPPMAAQYRATRHQLGEAFLSHFVCVVLEPCSRSEQEAIVMKRLANSRQQGPVPSKAEPGAIRLKQADHGRWLQGWEASWNAKTDAQGANTTRKVFCECVHVEPVALRFGSTESPATGLSWVLPSNPNSISGLGYGSLDIPTDKLQVKNSTMFIVSVESQSQDKFTGSSLKCRAEHFVKASRVLAGCGASCILLVDRYLTNLLDCRSVRNLFREASEPQPGEMLKLPPCVLVFVAENGDSDLFDAKTVNAQPRVVFRQMHCYGKALWDSMLRQLAANKTIASSLVSKTAINSDGCLGARSSSSW